jgi:hypothetical protein
MMDFIFLVPIMSQQQQELQHRLPRDTAVSVTAGNGQGGGPAGNSAGSTSRGSGGGPAANAANTVTVQQEELRRRLPNSSNMLLTADGRVGGRRVGGNADSTSRGQGGGPTGHVDRQQQQLPRDRDLPRRIAMVAPTGRQGGRPAGETVGSTSGRQGGGPATQQQQQELRRHPRYQDENDPDVEMMEVVRTIELGPGCPRDVTSFFGRPDQQSPSNSSNSSSDGGLCPHCGYPYGCHGYD